MLQAVTTLLCVQAAAAGYTSPYVRPAYNSPLLPEHHINARRSLECTTAAGSNGAAYDCPGQVHIALGGPQEMVISFAVSDPATPSVVQYGLSSDQLTSSATGTKTTYSATLFFPEYGGWDQLNDPNMGQPQPGASLSEMQKLQDTSTWAKHPDGSPITKLVTNPADKNNSNYPLKPGLGSYKNPFSYYDSPVLCSVILSQLEPGRKYYYSVSTDSRVFSFTMPNDSPAIPKSSFTIGLTADIGQTAVSKASMQALAEMKPDVILLSGDLSYADGWHPRWDTFGVLFEQVAASVPVMTVPGNHEVGDGEQYVNYIPRYPMPSLQSGSYDNTYWSRDIESMHVIGLNSYAGTSPTSMMYRWLAQDMRKIDRSRTPWVVVMMHTPWYNSNVGHEGEGIIMQQHMEKMLYDMGADIVINGHVHSYERTSPVYNWNVDVCGPVHLNLGDGGNREGAYVPWSDPQPAWSQFRESSFGVAKLEIKNSTHALYSWNRHACFDNGSHNNINFDGNCRTSTTKHGIDNGNTEISDSAWILRSDSCQNKRFTGDLAGMAASSKASGTDACNSSHSHGWMAVAIVFILVSVASLGLAASLAYKLHNISKADIGEQINDYHYMEDDNMTFVDMDRKNY